MIRLKMLYNKIVNGSAVESREKILLPFLHASWINSIHNSYLFVQNHIGVVGNALRDNVLAFKQIDGSVIYTDILYRI